MPIAVSPASYRPGASLARGSFTSDPVIPGGNVGAGVCARPATAKHEHRTSEVISKRKAVMCTRFIDSPLWVFTQHGFHNPDLGALTAVDVRCEIEQFGILPCAGCIEQILYHDQSTGMMLDHSGQKKSIELGILCF